MTLARHEPFLVPSEELDARIEAFQERLRASDVSLAWIDHVTDRFYLSGSNQDAVLLIPADGPPDYFVKKSLARARTESHLEVRPYPGRRGLLAAVRERLGPGASKLGLPFDVTPASTFVSLTHGLDRCEIVDIGGILRTLKATKSAWEIDQVRGAADQAAKIFSEIDAFLKPGVTELALTGAVEGRLRALGHGGPIRMRRPGLELAMICAISGDAALYPTNFDGPVGGEGPYPSAASGAGWKPIARGETVILDMVTSHNGYHADDARTFFMGDTVPERAHEAHAFCLGCLERLEHAMRPGRTCAEVYEEIDGWVNAAGEPEGFMGFGENRVKFLGHGVGLELDELPVIAAGVDQVLRPGMVVAVEPKAFLSGIGPVGVENTYRLTDDGCESLCKSGTEIVRISGQHTCIGG